MRNGAIVVQRSENFLDRDLYVVEAANVQESFLLARKRSVWQIFCGGGRAHRYSNFSITFSQLFEGLFYRGVQLCRKWRIDNPLTDILVGFQQGFHVVHVQTFQALFDAFAEAALLKEVSV